MPVEEMPFPSGNVLVHSCGWEPPFSAANVSVQHGQRGRPSKSVWWYKVGTAWEDYQICSQRAQIVKQVHFSLLL